MDDRQVDRLTWVNDRGRSGAAAGTGGIYLPAALFCETVLFYLERAG